MRIVESGAEKRRVNDVRGNRRYTPRKIVGDDRQAALRSAPFSLSCKVYETFTCTYLINCERSSPRASRAEHSEYTTLPSCAIINVIIHVVTSEGRRKVIENTSSNSGAYFGCLLIPNWPVIIQIGGSNTIKRLLIHYSNEVSYNCEYAVQIEFYSPQSIVHAKFHNY